MEVMFDGHFHGWIITHQPAFFITDSDAVSEWASYSPTRMWPEGPSSNSRAPPRHTGGLFTYPFCLLACFSVSQVHPQDEYSLKQKEIVGRALPGRVGLESSRSGGQLTGID
jgi:hypothetical protein